MVMKSVCLATKALVISNEFKAKTPVPKLRGFLSALAHDDFEKRQILANAKKMLLDDMRHAAISKQPFPSQEEIDAMISSLVTNLDKKDEPPARPSDSQTTQKIDRSLLKFLSAANKPEPPPRQEAPPRKEPPARKVSFAEQFHSATKPVGPHVYATKTILVADDDHRIRTMFRIQIADKIGHSVIEAQNGWEAWEIISKHPALSLIILDMKMPGKHGPEILEDMRTSRIDIPVIICSAYDYEDMLYPGGSNIRYFTKPISMEEMLDEIRRVLSNDSQIKTPAVAGGGPKGP